MIGPLSRPSARVAQPLPASHRPYGRGPNEEDIVDDQESDERVPVAEALASLEMPPLPTEWTPQAAIIIVKCLDEDGETTWAHRVTPGLEDEEIIGSLVVRADIARQWGADAYAPDDSEQG